MTSAMFAECGSDTSVVSLQAAGGHCVVTVDGKEEAVALRNKLVRRGIVCTFSYPTWRHSLHAFHATYPPGMSHATFAQLIHDLSRMQDDM
jgi:hypothetical protein